VIYPEGVWYSIKNQESDIASVLNHLISGEVAENLRMEID
jgi:(2Fe-2S) ferredoxin